MFYVEFTDTIVFYIRFPQTHNKNACSVTNNSSSVYADKNLKPYMQSVWSRTHDLSILRQLLCPLLSAAATEIIVSVTFRIINSLKWGAAVAQR
jgi:hypothetical protein